MKKIATLLIATVCALIAAFSFTACSASSDLERIKSKGTLVVGITYYPPMDYIGDDGEWTGFDADLANMVAEELGVTAQFVIIKWANKVAELNSGNIDLIWNGMTADQELGQNIDFSVAYAENRQVAIIKKSNAQAITTVEDIKAAKIAVENGSAGDTVATQTIQAGAVSRVTAQTDAVNEVLSGQSEVAIIDLTMANSIIGKGSYEELMIIDPENISFDREVFAVGLKKGSDLKEVLDGYFKKYYENGTLAQLAEKYPVALNEEALSAL